MLPLEVDIWRIHAFAILGSVLFLALIVFLIKSRLLREEYSLLWLGSAFVIIVASAWREGLVVLATMLGVAYAPAALFIVLIGAMTLLLLHFSVVLSQHRTEIRKLTQELALLQGGLEGRRGDADQPDGAGGE